ncbi:hypothetical protein ACFPK5_38125 [Streptomyces beijiangensis]
MTGPAGTGTTGNAGIIQGGAGPDTIVARGGDADRHTGGTGNDGTLR